MIQVEGYSIDDSKSRGRSQFKTKCPKCRELGKKHLGDDLSVNVNLKTFHCHKCSWSGYFGERNEKEQYKEYKLPPTNKLTQLNKEHLNIFLKRRITEDTIIRNKIQSAQGDWYAFVYYEGETIVNMKYRSGKEKRFMQAPEAKPTMYKYNDIANSDKIIICEGEFDALSWEEAGYRFATSVNQGAPQPNDTNVENKLACIYNCFDVFESAETIYLSVDNDPAGQRLQKELIKMFTPEKIKIIDFSDLYAGGVQMKDANDVLCNFGREKLKDCFKNAKEIPVDGIYNCSDFEFEIMRDWSEGQPAGTTTYFPDLDNRWKHRIGEVNIWTGYNNEGKSLFLKQLLLLKSKNDGWKHALFSPEEMPFNEWYTDVIESYIGKSADKLQDRYNNYMSEMQIKEGIKFMNEHFFMVYPEKDQTIDEILKRFSYLVRKQRIQTVTLDPYNQIQHMIERGEREDLYISRFMSKLKAFAVKHEVCLHLVAHQVTPQFVPNKNYPEPNIYTIKGGGTFSDKADNVLIVWRENRNTDISDTSVKFISKKIKKQKLTGIPGEVIFNYERKSNRYFLNGSSPLADRIETQTRINMKPNEDFYSNENKMDNNDPFGQTNDLECPY